jgi:hypothetical protein
MLFIPVLLGDFADAYLITLIFPSKPWGYLPELGVGLLKRRSGIYIEGSNCRYIQAVYVQ